MLVLAVHAFPSRFPNGYIGVDIFFVISGYLITSIIANELSEGRFSVREFYIRRVNRIFPPLLLVLVFVLLSGPLVMYAAEYKASLSSVWTGALFSANIDFFLGSGYWDTPSKVKPLLHLWSLGVEEQFYLTWPLLLAIFLRRKLSLLAAALLAFMASLALNLVLTGYNQAGAFFLPFGRIWELAAGGILALIQAQRGSQQSAQKSVWQDPTLRDVLGMGGALLLLVMQFAAMNEKQFPGFYAPVVVFCASTMIFAGKDAFFNRYLLSNPIAVYIGKISYPLYLWHWPLLVYARLAADGNLTSKGRNVALVLSFVLAMLTHHLIERPLSAKILRRGLLASVLAILMGIVAALSAGLHYMGGTYIPGTYANQPVTDYEVVKIGSQGKIILLGDSNAGHLSYGLGLLYGHRLKTFAIPGWPYLDGVRYRNGYIPHADYRGTPALTEKVLSEIESDSETKLVIISNAYLMYMPAADNIRFEEGGDDVSQIAGAAYASGLVKTINRLVSAGKKVLLVKSIPTYPELATVTACAGESRPIFRKKPAGCVKSRTVVNAERKEYEDILNDVRTKTSSLEIFDTMNVLCDQENCYVQKDGVLFYIDGGHFTTAGSQLMANHMALKIENMLRP